MRLRTYDSIALLLAVATVSASSAFAQSTPAADSRLLRSELAFDYSYVHSNAPPGGCGCFNMNGGSGSISWQFIPGQWALVGEIAAVHASSIGSADYDLLLTASTAGVRYLIPERRSALHPFAQVLIGAAHGGSTLIEGNTPAASDRTVFASNIGGGLDLRTSRRFTIRLIDADYLITTFKNGVNDHQNNLRLSAGVAFRF